MTALKMEAVSIIDSIEDSEMAEVVAVLRNFKINKKKKTTLKKGWRGWK